MDDLRKKIGAVDEFMITEYDRLKDMLLYTKEMGHSRTQFFVTLITGLGAVIMIMYQVSGSSREFFIASFLICLALFFFGIVTYVRLVRRAMNVIQYFRAMAKIRRYFSDKSVEAKQGDLDKYLFFNASDDSPSFDKDYNATSSSLRVIVMVITGILGALAFALVPVAFYEVAGIYVVTVVLSVLIFVVIVLSEEAYARYQFAAAEHRYADRISFSRTAGPKKSRRIRVKKK